MTTTKPDQPPIPFPTSEHHGKPQGKPEAVPAKPGEAKLDEGIEESFPASDPVSVNVTKVVKKPGAGPSGKSEKIDIGAAGDDSSDSAP
jgi:hypothetical protein